MALYRLLGIPPGITALIGSGGKSTLLALLARELEAAGARVLCAATTHMYPPAGMPLAHSPAEAAAALERGGPVCIGTWAEEGKLGPPREPLEAYLALCTHLLAEADGARRLPLKAHAPWEPVLPPGTERTVCVLGLTGLGRPIAEAAHRPELYARLADCRPEDAATPERAANVLNREALADIYYLNQADAAPEAAPALARLLERPAAWGSLHGRWLQCSF